MSGVGRTPLWGGGLAWGVRARLGKKGVCAGGGGSLGSLSPKNTRRESSSRDLRVLEPRCGEESIHMEERFMTALRDCLRTGESIK